MFPPHRIALMKGAHPVQHEPLAGHIYAFLIDVAGEDEGAAGGAGMMALSNPDLAQPGRDSTALTILEVDLSGLSDPLLQAPTYRVVNRKAWLGDRHSAIYAQLLALGELWAPRWWVVDATGVGAGLASFLEKAFPGRLLPFVFTSSSKSKLGWDFLSVVETGRFKDYSWSLDHPQDAPDSQLENRSISSRHFGEKWQPARWRSSQDRSAG